MIGSQMFTDPFVGHQEIVIVVAGDRCTVKDFHLGHFLQSGNGFLDPVQRWLLIDYSRIRQQVTPRLGFFIHQNYASASTTGSIRRSQTCRPGTYHQHITVCMELVVTVRVNLGRRVSQPRRLTNKFFIGQPHRLRPHESFIVKTCG